MVEILPTFWLGMPGMVVFLFEQIWYHVNFTFFYVHIRVGVSVVSFGSHVSCCSSFYQNHQTFKSVITFFWNAICKDIKCCFLTGGCLYKWTSDDQWRGGGVSTKVLEISLQVWLLGHTRQIISTCMYQRFWFCYIYL